MSDSESSSGSEPNAFDEELSSGWDTSSGSASLEAEGGEDTDVDILDNCVRIATDRLMYYLHFMDDGCKGVLWVSDALTRASKAAADLGSHTSK
ncbi:hypothetical protein L3X38_027083 [Prunus dulcis]|uniref:Uncharacterized protein n=1 Tax=Prunus dulcis TaxID=3755 RepID=A0AAD4VP30_PRUDU|nr:hypothetical protein L3X38_027083 [Prunus dulcis]